MASLKKLNVSLENIRAAQKVLSPLLPPSPMLRNAWLSEIYGCELYLKLENMQPIGSFKIRGATYKIATLTPEEKKRGVVAASAGNHAQGVAWGSRQLGVKAKIVMPRNAPIVKVENTRALGAEVVLEGDNYDEAYAAALQWCERTGAVYVHAFEDEKVIAGQGVVGLEIVDQLPQADFVISSIGGGGLLSGIGIVLKELSPKTRMIGCQAKGAPSMAESFRVKHAIKLDHVDTFADGIKVAQASEAVLEILLPKVEKILTTDDEAMAAAILSLMEKAKVVAEGAGALPLAVLDQIRNEIQGKKVVLVVSGGNIDVNVLSRIIDRGLTRAGRRLRMNVWISDRPGSLARLTELLAKNEVNIIQAIHDRNEPSTKMDETEVELTVETRSSEHTEQVVTALRGQVLKLEVLN